MVMLSKCFHCNGYYGPSFGQPVCSTCHMFLYPDDFSLHSSSFHCHDLKVEDGDSGNEEEPREPSDCNVAPDASGGDDPRKRDPGDEQPQQSPVSSDSPGMGARPPLLPPSQEPSPRDCSNNSLVGEEGGARAQGESAEKVVPQSPNSAEQYGATPPVWPDEHQEEREDDGEEFSSASAPPKEQETNIHHIPPEVLLNVFQYLDEVSLWSVGKVCRRWHQLMSSCSLQWKELIQRRWPLFNPIYEVTNWHKVLINLIESAPCQLCLFKMPYITIPPAHEDSWRRKRLINERRTLQSDPPEGINAFPLDNMSLHWQASIRGPAGSPYQGGTFFLYIQIPSNYPLSPPLVRFITRIFHPNVSRHGDIGIDSIQHNWSVAITISKVLVSIQSLLTDPYTKVCMEPRIGEMYDENRRQFDLIAKGWTWFHAMHDAIDPESMVPDYLRRITSGGRSAPHKVTEDSEKERESKGAKDLDKDKAVTVT